MNVKSRSRTIHGLLANRSISESDQRRALLLPQELMQMPKTELLLLRGGIAPVRGRKIAFYRMQRFTKRVLAPPILPSRRIPAAEPPTALPPGKHQVVSPSNDAEGPTAKSTGGALLEETKMREMTDGERTGAIEITDDMLVLGDLTDLPPPGDEAAAIAFVSAMIERALVQPAEPSSSSLIQERADHGR